MATGEASEYKRQSPALMELIFYGTETDNRQTENANI